MKYILIFFTLVSVLFITCVDPDEQPVFDVVEDYYPIEIGKYWVYQVDSVIYNQLNMSIDTSRSFIREEIVDISVLNNVDTSYIIERSIADSEGGNYEISDVWSVRIEDGRLIKTEENLPFIKLVYPISISTESWKGNSLFNAEEVRITVGSTEFDNAYSDLELFKYLEVDGTLELLGTTYEDVVYVNQSNIDGVFNSFVREEHYAKNVGMISLQHQILYTSCATCDTVPWTEKAEGGYILNQYLVSYGG